MQFEDFKEKLFNTEVKTFHCRLAYESELLRTPIRKIAGYVYTHTFAPVGEIMKRISDRDLNELISMVDLYSSPINSEMSESDCEIMNNNTFNLLTLVQIFLAGEGDVELKKQEEDVRQCIKILDNLLKIEKAHRIGLGIAIRENYSFICIDKIIFVTRM